MTGKTYSETNRVGRISPGKVFFKSVIAISFGIAASSYLFGYMFDAILDVLRSNDISITGMKASDPKVLKIGFSFIMGLVLSLPFVCTYILSHTSPVLYLSRKRRLFILAVTALFLYLAGAALFYLVCIPYVIELIKQLMPNEIFVFLRFREIFYKLFLQTVMIGFFVVLPIVRYILTEAGFFRAVKSSRQLGMVVLSAFIIGALVTPPDPVSMIIIAVFYIGLYEISALAIRVVKKTEPGLV